MHAVAFPAPTGCVIHPAPHMAHATVDALLYCPAAHAEHVVRASFTMFGAPHDAQSVPNGEKVAPTHSTHAVLFEVGSRPG